MHEMRQLLSRCVKCGQCRSICPVFQQVQREPATARGKMALLEAALHHHTDLTPNLLRTLSLCLLCGTCSATCPNGAEAHEAIRRARVIFADKQGLSLPKRILAKWTASDRSRRDRFAQGASALQELLTTEFPDDRGLRFRLPFRRFHEGWIPRLTRPFFLERTPREVRGPNPGAKVGLFVGCGIHYLAPQVGDATLHLLTGMGFTVVIPKEQGCCGLMAYGMGDDDTARRVARKTLEVFSNLNLDAIIAPCASCASHLKLGYPALQRENPVALEKANEFSSRLWELSTFLVHQCPPRFLQDAPRKTSGKVITYHDPCHLSRHMGVSEEPRALLGSLHSMTFREMEGADQCCGMGGSFRLSYPGVSRGILKSKTQAIAQSGAKMLVTGCMGCWMQLQEGLHAKRLDVEVMHLAECLWEERRIRGQYSDPLIAAGPTQW